MLLSESEWSSGCSKCPLSELCFKVLLSRSLLDDTLYFVCVQFNLKKKLPILAGLPVGGRISFQTCRNTGWEDNCWKNWRRVSKTENTQWKECVERFEERVGGGKNQINIGSRNKERLLLKNSSLIFKATNTILGNSVVVDLNKGFCEIWYLKRVVSCFDEVR